MGQQIRGIMYGCERPEDLNLHGDDDNDEGVSALGLVEWWDSMTAGDRRQFRIGWNFEGDKCMVGFWVAVEFKHHDKGQHAYATQMNFGSIDLATVASLPRVSAAKEAWKLLVKMAARQGVKLPKPSLWLVQTEVA